MTDWKTGMRVSHPSFGTGTIRAVAGSGSDARLTIDFGGGIGQKKLVAGLAHLQSDDTSASAQAANAWHERVNLEFKAGGRMPTADELRTELSRQDFWIEVRDRMRTAGLAPKVLDVLSGNVALRSAQARKFMLIVRHGEFLPPEQRLLGKVVAELLAARCGCVAALSEDFQVNGAWPDTDAITLADSSADNLPDRAPLHRPKRVQPKGVIRSLPKRRDDY